MKKKKKKKIVILSLLLSVSFYVTAYGYVYYANGYIDTYREISNYNMNDVWWNCVNNGRTSWNNAPTRVYFAVNSSSPNKIMAGNYPDNWYGQYSPDKVNLIGSALQFSIRLNSRAINSATDLTDWSKYVESTACHELGHSCFLSDIENSKTVLMGHARDRNDLYKPTDDDINGVNHNYPN